MEPLATVDELEILTGQTFASGEPLPTLVLEIASAVIRQEAGQTITLVEDDQVDLLGNWSRDLWLPERPVIAVGSVAIIGGNIDADWNLNSNIEPVSYTWNRQGLLRRYAGATWGGDGATVRLTYSHGHETIPDLIRGLCLQVAQRLFEDPAAAGIKQETIGSYSYKTDSAAGAALSDDERRLLRDYRWAA